MPNQRMETRTAAMVRRSRSAAGVAAWLTAPWSVVRLLPAHARADARRIALPGNHRDCRKPADHGRSCAATARTPWFSSAAIAASLVAPFGAQFSDGRGEDLRWPVEHRPTIRPLQSSRRTAAESVGHRRQSPGQAALSKMWNLRDGPSQELKAGPEWSYPCAIEFAGKLYVVYTAEKHHCVLTAIPVKSLAAAAATTTAPKVQPDES